MSHLGERRRGGGGGGILQSGRVQHSCIHLHADATRYFTQYFADLATSHDPKAFFLTLNANYDPRFEISRAHLP